MKIILFLFSAIVALVVAPPPPYSDHCIVGEKNLYPPPVTTPIPWYTINLDDPPETRWNEVSKAYATNITALIGVNYFFRMSVIITNVSIDNFSGN